MRDMLKDDLRKLLAKALKVPVDVLTDDISISKDLGVDSLDIIKLISIIEDKYDIEIDEAQVDLLDSLGTACRYINALIDKKQ